MLQVEQYGPIVKFCAARTFVGRSFYRTAAYWVDGLLIDTTCHFTATELLRVTAGLALEQIVNTHCHEDHIGANHALQMARSVAIQAHPLALPILEHPRLQYLQLYRRVFWGWPLPSQGSPIGEWVETKQYRFQVMYTPGHSPNHICLFEPSQGWLFSGDAYIGGQDRTARPDYDVYAIITSLRKLAALPVKQLFPGSGTVRLHDPVADIQRKVTQLEELGSQVRRLHAEGLSVPAIQRQLLGPDPSIRYLTLGHFRAKYLVEAYLRGM
jgi:glyoxylase-like metal-dependent hydrolase (beta-lactamase superfamily II)